MAKAKYLGQIKQRIDQIKKEYAALSQAYELLSSAGGTRGRKAAIPSLEEVVSQISAAPAAKGKRGRPSKKAAPVKAKGKRGRPAGKASKSAVKVPKPAVAKKGKRARNANLSSTIREIVAKNGRFTTSSQITDKVSSMYPGKDRSELGKYISVILANMKKRRELSVITVDDKGNKMRSGLWGLPTWFDGQKPKSDYIK